jgi:hypothetical protein
MDARVLEIVEDVIGIGDLDEFRLSLLRSLMRVVPSDWASLNDLGPNPDDVAVLVIPDRRRTSSTSTSSIATRTRSPPTTRARATAARRDSPTT